MSFPWLMVKLRRHQSISVKYQDESGATKLLENLDAATSELFQVSVEIIKFFIFYLSINHLSTKLTTLMESLLWIRLSLGMVILIQ